MNPTFKLQGKKVDVWLCHANAVEDKLDYFISLLSFEEKTRADRFKFAIHRKRFIISHGFKRSVLAKYLQLDPLNIQFCKGDKGKPYLSDTDNILQFNLSHTEDLTLLAVTKRSEVGIDIEYMNRKTDWQAICQRFFTKPEQLALFSLADEVQQKQAFYQLWTRKEAYIKVLGSGLSLSPTQFTLTVPPQSPALIEHHCEKYKTSKNIEFITLKLPLSLSNYCATLAFESPINEHFIYHFS